MRRVLPTLLVTFLFTLSTAVPVLAAKPDHAPSEIPPPFDFAAGDMCDFPLRLATTVDKSTTTTFPVADDGSQRVLTRGFAQGFAENLHDGTRKHAAGGFRFDVVYHADGSIGFTGSGQFYAYYFPGDPIEGLDAGIFQVNGRLTEHYAPDGSLVSATFSGRAVDLCEALG